MNYTFLEYETYVFTILEDCFSGYEKKSGLRKERFRD